MATYQDFIKAYNSNPNILNFDQVKFRPGAARTTPFGIDVTTPSVSPLRIHNAIDSAYSSRSGWEIYVPFDIKSSEYIDPYPNERLQEAFGFGALLFLYTDYGFHLRLAHISRDQISSKTLRKLNSRKGFQAGEYLCEAGNYGIGTGKHLHLEVVSDDKTSEVLNNVLQMKYEDQNPLTQQYGREQMLDFYDKAGLSTEEGDEAFQKEIDKRGVSFINSFICKRWDYHTRKDVTFYSSMELFGM